MNKLSGPIKLIQDSIKIFFVKENMMYLASIYLVLVPFQIFQYFQGSLVNTTTGGFKFTPIVGAAGVVNIVYFVIYLLTSLAAIFAVKNVVDNKSKDFKKTFSSAWSNLWGFIVVDLLVFLAVFGGIILLVIPGIIFGIWFSFSTYVFVQEGLKGTAALGKSHMLVKGRFWQVLGRMIVFGFFAGLVGALLSAIPFGIGSILASLAGGLFMLPSFLLYRELSA